MESLTIFHQCSKATKKSQIIHSKLDNFDRENFILDLIAVDKIARDNNVNCTFNNILESTDNLIDKYIPSRKITNEEYERKHKPWHYQRYFKKQ